MPATASMVTVTPKAVQKIREAFTKQGVTGGLRLGVLGGGCSGLSYMFKFDPKLVDLLPAVVEPLLRS